VFKFYSNLSGRRSLQPQDRVGGCLQ